MLVKITKEKWIGLLMAEERLRRLQQGGVDNWDWYGDSLNPEGEPDLDDLEKKLEAAYQEDSEIEY